jgi:hypothetical protein
MDAAVGRTVMKTPESLMRNGRVGPFCCAAQSPLHIAVQHIEYRRALMALEMVR